MLVGISSILLRFFIVLVIWASVWYFVEPKSPSRRIIRAAVLALALLVVGGLM